MNLSQLKSFVTLSECESYSEAAEAIGVTRPAVASNIKALEKKFAVKLFTRKNRRVRLSTLGQMLLPPARQAIGILNELQKSLEDAGSLKHNYLAIGVGEPSLGVELISAYMNLYPGVHIQATEGNALALMKELEGRKLDIAVLALTEPDDRFANFLYHTDELFLCVPTGHAWASRKSVKFKEISEHTLILPSIGTTCRKIIDTAFYKTRTTAKTIIEFDEWDPILEATAQGIGIGFLQGTFLTADPRVRALKVEGADMSVPQFVVCPFEYVQLQTVRAFLEITETMLGSRTV